MIGIRCTIASFDLLQPTIPSTLTDMNPINAQFSRQYDDVLLQIQMTKSIFGFKFGEEAVLILQIRARGPHLAYIGSRGSLTFYKDALTMSRHLLFQGRQLFPMCIFRLEAHAQSLRNADTWYFAFCSVFASIETFDKFLFAKLRDNHNPPTN